MRNKTLKIVFLFLFFLIFPSLVLAADSLEVVINEICWMGAENFPNNEWIELFNTTNKEIDISGWQIENAKSKNETLTILTAKIPTNGYFLICRKEIGGCDLIESALSLHNEYNKNGKLVLKDTAGNIIDATPEANDKQWPAGDNGTKQTMERKSSLISGNDSSNWQTSQNPAGTPKADNSVFTETESVGVKLQQTPPQQITYPSNIFINEILPSPKDADAENEWIEIFNGNNFEVVITGWQIRDSVGAIKTYTVPKETKIQPDGFLVFSRPETKIALQNSGDGLELLNPVGKVAHRVNYEKAPLGQSFNRTLSGWSWSTTLTPEKTNIITIPEAPKTEPSETLQEKGGQIKSSSPSSQLEENKKILAKISEKLPGSSNPLTIFLIAIGIAVGSGVIVLILKKRLIGEEIDIGEE